MDGIIDLASRDSSGTVGRKAGEVFPKQRIEMFKGGWWGGGVEKLIPLGARMYINFLGVSGDGVGVRDLGASK